MEHLMSERPLLNKDTKNNSANRTQDVEIPQPGPSLEHTDPQPPPTKRSRKDSSSSGTKIMDTTSTQSQTMTQEPTRGDSTMGGSPSPLQESPTSVQSDHSSLETPAVVQPGTSGFPFTMPHDFSQMSQETRHLNPPTAAAGETQDSAALQPDPTPNSGPLVTFNFQPSGFQTSGYNNGQQSLVARQSTHTMYPHAGTCYTVTSKLVMRKD